MDNCAHGLFIFIFRLTYQVKERDQSVRQDFVDNNNFGQDKQDLASVFSYLSVQSEFVACLHCKQAGSAVGINTHLR